MNSRQSLCVKDGNLHIGAFSATSLASKFGTPLYVMDAQYIRSVCDAFLSAMKEYGNGAVAYASKAFCTVATTKLMASMGMWFDAVSGGEIYLLKNAGVDMSKVIFHGNAKTANEIDEGVKAGVGYFAIDSNQEIENLEKFASKNGVKQKVLIRINPCVSAHTFEAVQTAAPQSKFGFTIDNGNAKDAILAIKSCQNLEFCGLHMHIGSQIYDYSAYDMAIEVITNFVKELFDDGIKIDVLDIGGGYGVYYTDEDPKFTPNRYGYTLQNILNKLKTEFQSKGLELPFVIVEPGRSVVGEAGVTLYSVTAIKDFPNVKKYVAVNGGMFDNPRYALYESKYSAIITSKADEPQQDVVTIAGKCCESGDIIAKEVALQRAEVGDILCVFSTGAYNYSMASNYNLNAIPPVVLVDGDKADYIVKPQTYQDIVRNNQVPEWLND